jgi:hypothetical protein
MKIKESDLNALYQETTSRGRSASCPDIDELSALAAGTIDESRRAAVVEHLTRCFECAREYQIASSLSPLRSGAGGASARPERRWMLTTAASVLLALLLGGWIFVANQRQHLAIARLQERIDAQQRSIDAAQRDRESESRTLAQMRQSLTTLSRPYAGMPIVDLDAGVTRGAGTDRLPAIPRSAELFTVILHLPPQDETSADARITGANGNALWTDRVAVDRTTSTVTLTFSRRTFAAGDYEVQIRRSGRDHVFRFRVE